MRQPSRSLGHRVGRRRRLSMLLGGIAVIGSLLPTAALVAPAPVRAAHTDEPTAVTIAGSFQSEAGCPGDWDPACAATGLDLDANDAVWQGSFDLPAGDFAYKAALDSGWDESYGQDGNDVALALGAPRAVRFYYDHETHWVTDDVRSVIAVAPGSFQSELGCSGDWDPSCLRSWLQDPDGDGRYTFETTDLPAGQYEGKVAINESWDENYGQGGTPGGDNLAFTVPNDGATVTFTYDAASHVLTIAAGHGPDGNVEWAGLQHDSRDRLYRTPGGAVPAGTEVKLRFRTFHDDVTSVRARLFSVDAGGARVVSMRRVASGVDCYEAALASERCDFWETTLEGDLGADNLWYRFVVSDGDDIDYYADDTAALDGGLGSATDDPIDQSWALMLHVPGFTSPDWAADAVIYQIFPDRFRNGRANNDLKTGAVRYDDPVLRLPWGVKPEGYCRNYEDGATDCPWRFDSTPPADSPTKEQPRGRDYFGGDLKGVDQQLDHLVAIGVNTIYFNPIFDAGSNHSYDTQDYRVIDPAFGTQKDWENLVKRADTLGIRIILDGVFNHLSSDSPFFDRYHHYPTAGACESMTSPYREWFVFSAQAGGACVGPDGPNTMTYEGWFGFDSIPVLRKSEAEVQAYFLTAPDSIAKRWLAAGASGWRLDVSGDPSFPDGYWETFRDVVRAQDPEALTISETWQKDSTLLRMIRGDRLDTTMSYRFRDAVLGLLAPGTFDSKGFADSGSAIEPSKFAARLLSIREDYPDAAYDAAMNLLDSHDTERIRWTLTPGPETTAGRELDAANVADGLVRQRLASLIQFTTPGAPTVYYGDEVGVTGDDDPDDRRTFPWADLGGTPDTALQQHYATLASLRRELGPLRDGDLDFRLTDDDADTVAYGRSTDSRAALVALNRDDTAQTLTIPVAGWLPNGTVLTRRYGVGTASSGTVTVAGGAVRLTLPPLSGLLLATGTLDLAGPSAPTGLHVTGESANTVDLAWNAVPGATGYVVYASPVSGGGYVRLNDTPTTGTTYSATGLENARRAFFVVRAVDAAGNLGAESSEVEGLPHLVIGWANLQWPPTITHTISATTRTPDIYGQVWIDGVTDAPGAAPSLRAQLGSGPDGSDPATADGWTWIEAAFNTNAGNNDEFVASLLPETTGTFDYAYRYTVTDGRDWIYADLDGIPYSADQAGALTVVASDDTTAPATPTGLEVVSASPAGIELTWDADASDPSLFAYEVRRSDEPGGPYTTLATTTDPTFTDTAVEEAATYHYVVRAVDTSFNRSADSAEVTATAELRTVTLQ
ncbi:MAG TPA: alpha-amylase family glycosyl hydrolase, partial [Candidatus Saccharimonadales bacterium]|nr:alpha-amylase family glycosyl hydrolase [Candidatus Saccharimonadales bacterium]